MKIIVLVAALVASLTSFRFADEKDAIAFMRGGKVWVCAADGSGERCLTKEEWWDRPLVWMPDGRAVLFWEHETGWNISSIGLDGKPPVKLTNTRGGDCRSAAPSPDGKLIAFMRSAPQGLWIMKPDGSDEKRLTEKGHRDEPPVWSPDGKTLLYTHIEDMGKETVRFELRRVDVSGEDDVLLTQGEDPVWAPDGSVFYMSTYVGDVRCIGSFTPDGKLKARITRHDLSSRHPRLSKDGKMIAYLAAHDGKTELRISDTWGKLDVKLATFEGRVWAPSWSPDGTMIAVSAGEKDAARLHVVDVKSKSVRHTSVEVAACAVWRP